MIRVYKFLVHCSVYCALAFSTLSHADKDTVVFLLNEYQSFATEENKSVLESIGFPQLQEKNCVVEPQLLERCLQTAMDDANGDAVVFTAKDPSSALLFFAQDQFNKQVRSIILFGFDANRNGSSEALVGLPETLVVSTPQDFSSSIIRSRRAVSDLRESGVSISFIMVPINKGNSLAYLDEDAALTKAIAHFSGVEVDDEDFVEEFEAFVRWQDPPLASAAYWELSDLIETYPLDKKSRLATILEFFYKKKPHLQKQWSMDEYHAFDVLAYRKHLGLNEAYRFLTLHNYRGHQIRVDLNDYEQYEPVIVIGIGQEEDLFRWTWFYKTKAKYTWKDAGAPELSARTLGPFLYFRKPLPRALSIPLLMRSALKFEGMQFVKEDPLQDLYELPENIHQVLLKEGRCIDCHAVGDLGGRGYHISAKTGKGHDGFALPLAEYSAEVLEAFLFDQENVAAQLGMTPLKVRPDAAKEMYNWLSQSRE